MNSIIRRSIESTDTNQSNNSLRFALGAALAALLIGCQTPARVTDTPSDPVVSTTASTDILTTGYAIADAVQDWLATQKTTGSVAVSYLGAPVIRQGFGRNPDTPYPVASLSKAITAICMQQLLDAQQASSNLTLGEAIPNLLRLHPPADKRLTGVTLSQLMSHNSGIHSRYHRDYIADNRAYDLFDMRAQYKALAREKLSADPGSGYHYSNANYLLLGLAIEEMSTQSYVQYCNDTTLKPAAISADINPQWRVMSSWGGWRLSASDYLKFLHRYFLPADATGRRHKKHDVGVHVGGGAYYTYGVLTREANGGSRFWHTGAWHWRTLFMNDQFGAYFVTREDGLMVSINYATSAQDTPLQDLQQRLVEVMNL